MNPRRARCYRIIISDLNSMFAQQCPRANLYLPRLSFCLYTLVSCSKLWFPRPNANVPLELASSSACPKEILVSRNGGTFWACKSTALQLMHSISFRSSLFWLSYGSVFYINSVDASGLSHFNGMQSQSSLNPQTEARCRRIHFTTCQSPMEN